ncbi:hypothetical protein KIN20_036208 [Parelaphostrongylus tenuis]|uniref:7TM GPCR serpentine receptor class x (Srx) domain-containing protein n=1 Tax=Parelaphostrongylus tenuis TaxID=148309 RepID=A0AAD5RCI5_PARTN|nr:hypothetical protein KIN20_036208 [Parelaphostrongylus tenuis]
MAALSTAPLNIHSENIAVSVIIALMGVVGLVSNGAAIGAVRYNPALQNSFGLLCFSQIIANTSVLIVFVFWIVPITLLRHHLLLGTTDLSPSRVMKWRGYRRGLSYSND